MKMKKEQLPLITMLSAIALILATGILGYLLPHIPLAWQITGGLAVLTTIGYVVLDRKYYATALGKRTTQYGLNSIFMSFIAVAVVVMLNYIVAQHDIKKDFTKNKSHTLSDQSVKVVQGLKQEVRLRAFVAPQQQAEFDNLLNKYTYHSKMLKKDYIDVDKEPMAVQKYGIKQPGTVIVETDKRSARVDNLFGGSDDPKVEEKITNAIISVDKGEKKKVYFLTGHGERLATDSGKEGYSEMKESMESSRYQVEELLLVDKDKVPTDAEVLIVAGPKSDFMDHELKLLEEYLMRGGKMLFMVEPTSTPTAKAFLAKFGADWKPKKTVVEMNRLQQLAGGSPLTPIVNTYSTGNEITAEIKQMSIFPIASPVEKMATTPSGYKVDSLFSTTNRSLEVELKGNEVKPNEKTDRKGPLSLALAVSGKAPNAAKPAAPEEKKEEKKEGEKKEADNKDPEFRLVIVGDSDFGANQVRRFGVNADLFQNMVSWLAKEEDLISIRPKPTNTSEFEITEERFRVVHLASVWILPPLMLLSGLGVWFKRRRK